MADRRREFVCNYQADLQRVRMEIVSLELQEPLPSYVFMK